MNLTRRETLRGGSAAVVGIAAAGSVAAAEPAVVSHGKQSDSTAYPPLDPEAVVHEPLLELERQWRSVGAEIAERDQWCEDQCAKLPAWAQTEPGGYSGWPDVSDLPEFEGAIGRDRLSNRPFRADIEQYNLFAEIMAKHDPERLAAVKVEGKARNDERNRLERELGIWDWDEQLKPLHDRMSEIEREMTLTPALTLAGVAVKLRFWDNIKGPVEESDIEECLLDQAFVLSALRDIERMSGEGSA